MPDFESSSGKCSDCSIHIHCADILTRRNLRIRRNSIYDGDPIVEVGLL